MDASDNQKSLENGKKGTGFGPQDWRNSTAAVGHLSPPASPAEVVYPDPLSSDYQTSKRRQSRLVIILPVRTGVSEDIRGADTLIRMVSWGSHHK